MMLIDRHIVHTIAPYMLLQLATFLALTLGFIESRKEIRRRRDAKHISQTQSRLRSELVDLVPFPITVRDRDGVYIDLTAAAADTIGQPRDLILGGTEDDCAPLSAAFGLLSDEIRKTLHSTRVGDGLRVEYIDRTVRQKCALFWNRPIYDERGGVIGWIGAFTDVTETVGAERKMRETEARPDDVTRNFPAAVFQIRCETGGTPTHPFLVGNADLFPHFALSKKDGGGERRSPLIKPAHEPRLLNAISKSARTLAPIAADFEADDASGARRLHVEAVPKLEPGGSVLWNAYWTDVSADRRRLAGTEAARDTAQQASAANDHFLTMMSHEIRTPMSGVLGLVEFLAQSGLQTSKLRWSL